ncbi:MAG: hypothetical protein DMD82_01630 [Candidatus Rokuibacteriota bacterium]|nr:MAG: hypothetical protein DMD82_01630 [Candidatus Rokubacteria bacterium]
MKEQRTVIFRTFKKPSTVMRLGLLFLVLGNLSNILLRSSRLVSENSRDLIMGMFYGLAIGTLLVWGIMRRTSPPRS